MRIFLLFLFILIVTNSVFPIQAPVGDDPVTGEPVYEKLNSEEIIIDYTKREVTMPSGKTIVVEIGKQKSDLPEDLQMMGIDTSEEPVTTTDNQGTTTGDLPEDMADILGDGGTDSGDNSNGTGSSSGGNDGSPSNSGNEGNTGTDLADSGSTTGAETQDSSASSLKILWFVMACLVILLIISVVYVLSNKKTAPAGE